MKSDIREIYELIYILEEFEKKKINLKKEHKELFEEIKEFLYRRNKFPLFYDISNIKSEDEVNKIEADDEKIKNMVKNMKKNFFTNIFDLNQFFKKEDLKELKKILREAINDFFYDLIYIKKKASETDELLLYYISRKRVKREKNENKNLFIEIKKRSKGLDTTPFVDMLFKHIANIDSIRSEVEKSKIEAMKYHKEIIDIMINGKINKGEKIYHFFIEIKEKYDNVEKKIIDIIIDYDTFFDNILNLKKLDIDKKNISSINSDRKKIFIHSIRNRFLLYFYLESYFILDVITRNKKMFFSEEIRAALFEKNSKISNKWNIKEKTDIEKNKIILEEKKLKEILTNFLSKKGKLKNGKRITIEELKKELEKDSLDDFIKKFIEYWRHFKSKIEFKEFFKNYFTEKFATYLKLNDYISELNLYLSIMEKINSLNIDILKNRYSLEKYKNFTQNWHIFEKLKKEELFLCHNRETGIEFEYHEIYEEPLENIFDDEIKHKKIQKTYDTNIIDEEKKLII